MGWVQCQGGSVNVIILVCYSVFFFEVVVDVLVDGVVCLQEMLQVLLLFREDIQCEVVVIDVEYCLIQQYELLCWEVVVCYVVSVFVVFCCFQVGSVDVLVGDFVVLQVVLGDFYCIYYVVW